VGNRVAEAAPRQAAHPLRERGATLALGSSALDGYDETFSQLTDVDMKFGTIVGDDGQEHPLTQSSYSSFLVKRDPELRKKAFHQFYAEFEDHQFTLAAALSYSVKADVFRARARNHPSALEASLFRDDVPVAVYDGLISSVRKNVAPLFRYYELRRRVLGLDELHPYDTYVPLVPEIETHVSFDEAIEKVVASLQPLGDEYVRTLAMACEIAGAIATRRKGNAAARFHPAATAHRPTSS
jgi:oligoendopeptidase F